jgi:hypothetical protein
MKKNEFETKGIVVFVLGIIGAIVFVLRACEIIPQIHF